MIVLNMDGAREDIQKIFVSIRSFVASMRFVVILNILMIILMTYNIVEGVNNNIKSRTLPFCRR